MTSDTWLDEEDAEGSLDSYARGGALSVQGRERAIRDALPIIGRFFQKQGSSERLVSTNTISTQVGASEEPDQALIASLRLRAALAAAIPIQDAIEAVAARPTFRYALQSSESVGYLAGTLDVSRYVARPYRDGGPPTYPVTDVYRSSVTPENVFAAYSALWMRQELTEALEGSDAPPQSPESQAATELMANFGRLLTIPTLADCRAAATDRLRAGTGEALAEETENRLRRGEVAHPDPYQVLLEVMGHLEESGPSGLPGTQAWSFYDEAFDTRLFELWCAFTVATELSRALATEVPPIQPGWTGSGLTFRWQRPNGTFELYMQKSLHSIDDYRKRRWKRRDDNRYLGGIPDIVVRGVTLEGTSRWAILDAKLRQRSGPPTEELYKILGYFDNYNLNDDPHGSILFYTPDDSDAISRVYVPDSDHPGALIATALNPADREQVQAGMVEVTDMLLSLLSLPPSAPRDESYSPAEAYLARLVEEMRSAKGQIAPDTLDASRRRLAALLGNDTWHCLDFDCRDMLATGEYVGFTLDPQGGDFSGPVLSMVSPLEVILHEHLWIPATEGLSNRQRQNRQTLGQVVDSVSQSLDGADSPLGEAIRVEVQERSLSESALREALEELQNVNRDFRRRAAHREKLTAEDWNLAFNRVVGQGRVLPRLLEALDVHPSPSEVVGSIP